MDNVRVCTIDEAPSLHIAAFEAAARIACPSNEDPVYSTPSRVLLPNDGDDIDYFSTSFDELYFENYNDDDVYADGDSPLHLPRFLTLFSII